MTGRDPKPPDLQEWVARYGGYNEIDWEAWDKAMADYEAARRAFLLRPAPPADPEALCICGLAGVYWRPRKGGGRPIWRCQEHRDKWPDYASEMPQRASR
jgi:hypothetical protein